MTEVEETALVRIAQVAEQLGVTQADAAQRFRWLERDTAARHGGDRAATLAQLVALPLRELTLALAHRDELGGLLFPDEVRIVASPADVSPENTPPAEPEAEPAAANADDAPRPKKKR